MAKPGGSPQRDPTVYMWRVLYHPGLGLDYAVLTEACGGRDCKTEEHIVVLQRQRDPYLARRAELLSRKCEADEQPQSNRKKCPSSLLLGAALLAYTCTRIHLCTFLHKQSVLAHAEGRRQKHHQGHGPRKRALFDRPLGQPLPQYLGCG
jgi:hypothetical protein